jgi:hypothetical protein
MRMRRSIVLVALVLAVAGCASHPAPHLRASRPAPPLSAEPQPMIPAVPLSVHVILPSRTMTAGAPLAGWVEVENHTGHAIRTEGCNALFAVALASSRYHPVVAVTTCAERLTIPEGQSSYRVQVLANYLSCSVGHASGARPACLPGMRMPPLPPGRYRATLFFLVSQFAPAPPAIPVLVRPAVATRRATS